MINSKKIVLIGHFGVGKSSLIRRLVSDVFSEDYKVTIGAHVFKKEIKINNSILSFVIWDLEGKDSIKKIRKSYLIGTAGFIYVIDPTRSSTYMNIDSEINYLKTNYPKAQLLTIANKLDLIDKDEFLTEFHDPIDFFTSAKTRDNVDAIFNQMGINILHSL
ncbi:Rab family GTPase [uncultured Flavobacterium sp.]|uniref:Rab family GTPase n=1 Tax=uncultured Flavobacterium sp. TaxID=165435 RepID=UPI0030CA556E|tara:strand:- start:570 stop:1055 length:486 start_codon:yes stop_codon:yes gene_type:complete